MVPTKRADAQVALEVDQTCKRRRRKRGTRDPPLPTRHEPATATDRQDVDPLAGVPVVITTRCMESTDRVAEGVRGRLDPAQSPIPGFGGNRRKRT